MPGDCSQGSTSRDGEGASTGRRSQSDCPPVDRERAWACIDIVRAIAGEDGVSVARVALAWILSKPFVTSLIIQNLGAAR